MVKINKTAVLTGLGGLVLGAFIGAKILPAPSISTQEPQVPSVVHTPIPYYKGYTQRTIEFGDNLAPGMKAYADYYNSDDGYGWGLIELKALELAQDYGLYLIPEKLKEEADKEGLGSLRVYAVDRDHHMSEKKWLYILDGVVLKEHPSELE